MLTAIALMMQSAERSPIDLIFGVSHLKNDCFIIGKSWTKEQVEFWHKWIENGCKPWLRGIDIST